MMEELSEDLASTALALARRFAAGATMWCASPRWSAHGQHVAVEFVHPVIVGKRALPAVHVESPDLVAAIRLLARPGDVVLAIGAADDDQVRAVLRRSEPWGVTSLWLGAGPRPPAGLADHVVWIDDTDAAIAARSGRLVLLYHLLWELTHVVFEHPGLLAAGAVCTEDVCVTCADEGRVAEVAARRDDGRAEVVAAGVVETIDVSLIDPVRPGDLVVVHAGVAITLLAETAS
jgi:hydrogenase maturation factor